VSGAFQEVGEHRNAFNALLVCPLFIISSHSAGHRCTEATVGPKQHSHSRNRTLDCRSAHDFSGRENQSCPMMDGLCNSDHLSRPITRVTLNARDHPAEARLLEIKRSAKRGFKIAIVARVKMSGLGAVRCPRLPEGPGQLQGHTCVLAAKLFAPSMGRWLGALRNESFSDLAPR
jgi:hypothetical protein